MLPLPRIPLAVLTAAILGLGTTSAIDLEGLVKNPPFGGTGAPAGPGVAPSTLEFRGMYAEGGVNYYSIYNSQTKQSSWVAEGEAPSANVPVVVKGFDAANESLVIDNGGQPQQMALHQAVVVAYRGPSAAQLAAVSTAVPGAPTVPGAPGAGGVNMQNLTPEQIEAFRQQMKERFGKRGQDGNADPRQRGDAATAKTPKTPTAAPTTAKSAKTPKAR
jgi:hypothetical protein